MTGKQRYKKDEIEGNLKKKKERKIHFIIYTFRNMYVWEIPRSGSSAHHYAFPNMPSLFCSSCGSHSSTQFLSKQLNPILSPAVFGTHITLHCDACGVVNLYLPLWLTAVLISSKNPHVNRRKKISTKTQLPKHSSFPAQAEISVLSPSAAEMSYTIIWHSKAWTIRNSSHVKKIDNPQRCYSWYTTRHQIDWDFATVNLGLTCTYVMNE